MSVRQCRAPPHQKQEEKEQLHQRQAQRPRLKEPSPTRFCMPSSTSWHRSILVICLWCPLTAKFISRSEGRWPKTEGHMIITPRTIIRILTGSWSEEEYRAFLEEAKTVNQEILEHQHRDISKWLSHLLRHEFGRSYNELLPRTARYNAEYLH